MDAISSGASRCLWLKDRPFGLMVHFLPDVLSRRGSLCPPDWSDAVGAFSVKRFCDAVEASGARWLIFPYGQNKGKYCAPNEALDSYVEGFTCERNLPFEIACRLAPKKIKFVGYLPSEIFFREPEFKDALGWGIDASKDSFQRRWEEVVSCWSEQMKALLSGWWFDGCYDAPSMDFIPSPDNAWTNARFKESWFAAARAGNPNAAVAMNTGADRFEAVSPSQDFMAGELNSLLLPPAGESPCAKHSLIWLDCFWGFTAESLKLKPGAKAEMPPPRFLKDELLGWLKATGNLGGAATFNVGVYRDGSLAEDSVELLRSVAESYSK